MFISRAVKLTMNSTPNPTRKTRKMSVNNTPPMEVSTCPCLSLATVNFANSLIIVVIIELINKLLFRHKNDLDTHSLIAFCSPTLYYYRLLGLDTLWFYLA